MECISQYWYACPNDISRHDLAVIHWYSIYPRYLRMLLGIPDILGINSMYGFYWYILVYKVFKVSTGMAGYLGIIWFFTQNVMKIKNSRRLRVNLFGIQSMLFCPPPTPRSTHLPNPLLSFLTHHGRETIQIYGQ